MGSESDLILERIVDVPPQLVFKAWTTPKHLMPWFCPKPYRTTDCEMSVTMLFDGSSFALFDGGSQFRFRAVVERTGTGTGNRRAVEA